MVSVILFIIFPIISLPISLLYYLFDKNKKGIVYSAIIGITLGICAYYFIPRVDYDLYRHQLIVSQLTGINFNQFLILLKEIELEFLPALYSYIISFFHNANLLQFFIVSLGYSILLYMLYDYRKQTNISTIPFIIVSLFVLFGFNALNFISGLYYYIAVIIFSLAFYLEYNKGKKTLPYILYIMTLFIHNSIAFALAVLLIYKLCLNKFNFKSGFICVFMFSLAFYVITFINNVFDIKFLDTILNMYNSYVTRDDTFKVFYSGTILFIEITKIIATIMCIFIQKEHKKFNGTNGFVLLLTLSTIIMMLKSRVMIRFAMLIQFIGITSLIDCFEKVKQRKILFLTLIIVLSFIYILYFYLVFRAQNFGALNQNIFKNIVQVFRKV